MTNQRYRDLRSQLGSQEAVAATLKVSRSTIARREAGTMPITAAAEMALLTLHLLQVQRPRPLSYADYAARPSLLPPEGPPQPPPTKKQHRNTVKRHAKPSSK